MAQYNSVYAECNHIKREIPQHVVDEKIAREIGLNYRTIPTFEKGLYEHQCIQQYSLRNNRLLQCRWTEYKKHLEGRVFEPFQFPDIRDLHFYNCAMRFLPSESINRNTDYRMKLKVGPGVDFRGQMPIPQEHLKRGKIEKDGGPSKKRMSAKKRYIQQSKAPKIDTFKDFLCILI